MKKKYNSIIFFSNEREINFFFKTNIEFYFQSSNRMSISDDSLDMDQSPRARSTSVSEMMMKLSPPPVPALPQRGQELVSVF